MCFKASITCLLFMLLGKCRLYNFSVMVNPTTVETPRRSFSTRCTIGRLPFGAHVRPIGSRNENPNSSKKTMVTPRRRAFFDTQPILPQPCVALSKRVRTSASSSSPCFKMMIPYSRRCERRTWIYFKGRRPRGNAARDSRRGKWRRIVRT